MIIGSVAGLSALAGPSALVAAVATDVAIGYGFWRGNERHPASVIGGVVLLISSTAFLVWIGLALVAAAALSR